MSLSVTSLDFAGLICSRICHDLLGPVGAILNGLELLEGETEEDAREQFLDLVGQSARGTAARLQFFRLALGAGSSFGDEIDAQDVRAMIGALAQEKQGICLDWGLSSDKFSHQAAKIVLNLVQIMMDALVRGGVISVEEGAGQIIVCAQGERIAFDPAIGNALEEEIPLAQLSARTAPAAMVRALCGQAVSVVREESTLTMTVSLPVTMAGQSREGQ